MALKKITFSVEPATQLAGPGDNYKTRPVKGDAVDAIYIEQDPEQSGQETHRIYFKEELPSAPVAIKALFFDSASIASSGDGFPIALYDVTSKRVVIGSGLNSTTRLIVEVWYEE